MNNDNTVYAVDFSSLLGEFKNAQSKRTYNTAINTMSFNYSDFKSTDQATPTSRQLYGSGDHGMAEEWSEPGVCGTTDVTCYYIFSGDDITWDDGTIKDAEDYPFDADHVKKIIAAEV